LIDDVPEIRTIDTNDLLASSTTDMVVDHPFYSRFFKTKDNVSHMLEVSRLLAAVDEVIGDASTLVQGRNEGDDGATESEPYLGR
jgi:chemotaxis signal transduction protein